MISPVLSTPVTSAFPQTTLPAARTASSEARPPVSAANPSSAPVTAGASATLPPAAGPAQELSQPAFDQLIEDLVTVATAQPGPTAAPRVKALPKANPLPIEALPPVPISSSQIPVTASALAPLTARRASPSAAGAANSAQPPALPVDANIPAPILPPPALKPASPLQAGGNTEINPEINPEIRNDVATPIKLEPPAMLDVKIHLDQAATPAAPPVPAVHRTETLPVAPSAPSAPVLASPREQSPLRPAPTSAAVQPAQASDRSTDGASAKQQNAEREPSDPSAARAPSRSLSPAQPAANISAGEDPGLAPPKIVSEPATVSGAPQHQMAATAAAAPLQNSSAPAPQVASQPFTQSAVGPAPKTAPASANAMPDPVEPPDLPKTQQPLRSMALEFAPDGAADVKVRLSERGGDVHISLHGTDPALAGRVREGVGDLVGSLSKAGYGAEAWTPSRDRQSQGREQDQRQTTRHSNGNDNAEEFSGILQQPSQENS